MTKNLIELECLFWQSVRGDAGVAAAVEASFVGSERLAIYQRMYVARQVNALREAYPKLAARLGERFERLARDYLLAHPSEQPAIEWVGARLGDFMSAREIEASALARLEWARSEVFLKPDSGSIALLLEIDPARFAAARLEFVPALSVVTVTQAALDAWDDPLAPWDRAAEPATALVWRAEHRVRHRQLDLDEAAALESARGSARLERVCLAFCDAAEPVERTFRVLRSWFEQRLIASVVLACAVLLLAACGAAEPESAAEVTGPLMRPGEDCLRCHSERSMTGAPPWTIAGTVFPDRNATSDRGVSGVRVIVSDARARSVELVSNSAGNFYSDAALEVPLRIAIEYQGQRREMPMRAPSGGCNACHSSQPIGGTEGRLYVPDAHPGRASCGSESELVLPTDDGRYTCAPERCVTEPAPRCQSGCAADGDCLSGASCREGRCSCPLGAACCSFASDCEGSAVCRCAEPNCRVRSCLSAE